MKRHPMTIVIDFNMVVSIKNLPSVCSLGVAAQAR